MKVHNHGKSAKAVFLASCMLLCAVVPFVTSWNDDNDVSAADKPGYNYVSFGDSMVNGYGMTGYNDGNLRGYLNIVGNDVGEGNTYPNMIAEELSDFFTVDHKQLAISGMRSADLRYLLYEGQFPGESFDVMGYEDRVEELSSVYIDAVSNADLITYQFNYDFTMPLADQLCSLMGWPSNGSSMKYDAYVDSNILNFVSDFKERLYTYFVDNGVLNEDNMKTVELVDGFVTAGLYVIISYCSNFDANMAKIFELNNDVEVIVLDSYTTLGDVKFRIGDDDVSLGFFFNVIYDIVNLYTKYLSPYSFVTHHCDLDETPRMFFHDFIGDGYIGNDSKNVAWGGLNDKFWFSFDTNPALDEDGYISYDLADKNGKLTEFLNILFENGELSFDIMIHNPLVAMDYVDKLIGTNGMFYEDSCNIIYNEVDGSCVIVADGFDDLEIDYVYMNVIWMNLRVVVLTHIMGHLSESGHEMIMDKVDDVLAPIVFELVDDEVLGAPVALNNGGAQTSSYGTLLNLTDGLSNIGNVTYPEAVAESLGLGLSDVVAPFDSRVNDLVYLLGGVETKDAVTQGLIEALCADLEMTEAEVRAMYQEAVLESDVVLVNISSQNILSGAIDVVTVLNGGEMEPVDFSALGVIPEDLYADVQNLRAELGSILDQMFVNYPDLMASIDTASYIIDVVAYNFITYTTYYDMLVDTIAQINPDAQIIVAGAYNMFDGFVYENADPAFTVDLGMIAGFLVQGVNTFYGYQLSDDQNVMYVDLTYAHVNDEKMDIAKVLESGDIAQILGYVTLSSDEIGVIAESVAQGYPAVTYTMTFEVGDDFVETELMFGDYINVPIVGDKIGYRFAGWDIVVPETMPACDLYAVAQWEPITYSIVFDSNGGNGTMDIQTMTYDVSEAIFANEFTYSGYRFAGWNTSQDGIGDSYDDSEVVLNLCEVQGAVVTLYAQWEAVPAGETHGELSGTAIAAIVVVIVAALALAFVMYRRH